MESKNLICQHFIHEPYYPFCDDCEATSPFQDTKKYFGCSLCKYQYCVSHLEEKSRREGEENPRKRRKTERVSVQSLPTDVLVHILSYFSVYGIRMCAMTCQFFKSAEKAALSYVTTATIGQELVLKNLPWLKKSDNPSKKRDLSYLVDVTAGFCRKLKHFTILEADPHTIEQGVFNALSIKSLETLHIECTRDGVKQVNNPSPKPLRRMFINMYRSKFANLQNITLYSQEIIWILDPNCISRLLTNCPELETLRLKLFLGLGQAFRNCTVTSEKLKILELNQCNIVDDDCKGIAQAFPNLEVIDFTQNNVSDEGIMQAVFSQKRVRKVNFTGLSLTTHTLRQLARPNTCPKLVELKMNFSSYMDCTMNVHRNQEDTLKMCRDAMKEKPQCKLIAAVCPPSVS